MGGYGGGGSGRLHTILHCHHQNDSCIKMVNDESHFNVSLIVRGKVTRQCPQTKTFLKRLVLNTNDLFYQSACERGSQKKSAGSCQQQVLKKDVRLTPLENPSMQSAVKVTLMYCRCPAAINYVVLPQPFKPNSRERRTRVGS